MLNRLLLPLLTLFIVWLGYTTYQLIQEDHRTFAQEQRYHQSTPAKLSQASTQPPPIYYAQER